MTELIPVRSKVRTETSKVYVVTASYTGDEHTKGFHFGLQLQRQAPNTQNLEPPVNISASMRYWLKAP